MKIIKVKPAGIASVYSGKDGKCCCGCAGTHSTYTHQITRVLKIINDEIASRYLAVEFDPQYVAVSVGNRIYIAYFKAPAPKPAADPIGEFVSLVLARSTEADRQATNA